MSDWNTEILEKPNWQDHIKDFFEPEDVNCMSARSIDLQTYYGVRLNADRIHFHTQRGTMPPQAGRRWTDIKVQNFYNWMAAGYPEQEAQFHIFNLKTDGAPRKRRNLREYEYDQDALDQLKKAFSGMMTKDVEDPTGYFKLAAIHWLPAPALYCRHHENAYNPWHRAYLNAFEDAMREIEGCEEITLPYWDIQGGYIPDFMWQEPFDAYEFKTDVKDFRDKVAAKSGDRTERKTKVALLNGIKDFKVSPGGLGIDGFINQALGAEKWQDFNGWMNGANRRHNGIIMAHDLGHVLCGTESVPGQFNLSLAVPNFAAYDPLFWFFHCNWDRLWWLWQRQVKSTTVEAFKTLATTEDDPSDWIDDPVLSMLQPFGVFTKDVINATDWQIEYSTPAQESSIQPSSFAVSSASAHEGVRISSTKAISVRVKDINRLAIPGSFYVKLLADGEELAKTYVFQSDAPQLCLSCTKSGQFSVDFLLGADQIENKKLEVRIICMALEGPKEIPPLSCGSPTINARLLMN
ncbi:MAG: hypothetical protein GKR93_04485 [Gammaproteobacteria bacterium]|nr:hypothetical protein [Gammaproteobacteria bacterium]